MKTKDLCIGAAFLLAMGLAGCEDSDMPGLGKDANTTYSGDNLTLTYGGSVMEGKQITFHTYDGEKASIEMSGALDLNALFPNENLPEIGLLAPGVVPGEIVTQLQNVPLTVGENGSYAFSGTDSSNGRELFYKGEVSATGMVMDVQVKMPDDEIAGTWNLADGQSLSLVWDTDGTIDLGNSSISINMLAGLASPILSDLIAGKLQSVSFREDGNVTIHYQKSGAGWQDSPLNMAQYYLHEGKFFLQLNASPILEIATRTRAAGLTDLVGMLTGLVGYLSEGIPLAYSVGTDGALTLTLQTEDAKAILQLLSLDFVAEKVQTLFPEEYQAIAQSLLQQLPELLESTRQLEISLTLAPAE